MIQGSAEWHAWRHAGIGGSDIAAILGISPYRTRLDVYEDKTGPVNLNPETNYIFEKGHKAEPKVRALLEMREMTTFEPCLLECEQFPFMRVSLDGRSTDKKKLLEAKFVGLKSFEDMKTAGKIPEYYDCQVQYQLFISDGDVCYYAAMTERTIEVNGQPAVQEEHCILETAPNYEMQSHVVNEVYDFWHSHILAKVPPADVKADWKNLRKKGLTDRSRQYLNYMEHGLVEMAAPIREEILTLANDHGHPRLLAGDLRLVKKDGIYQIIS